MAKMEDENEQESVHGHITSISVLRSHRKLGIATKLMKASEYAMMKVYDAEYVSLHVRVTNRAAIGLYKDVLGFKIMKTDIGYYADGEDAYDMRLYFKDLKISKKDQGKNEQEEIKKEEVALSQGDQDASKKVDVLAEESNSK